MTLRRQCYQTLNTIVRTQIRSCKCRSEGGACAMIGAKQRYIRKGSVCWEHICNVSQSPPFGPYLIHIKQCTAYRQPLLFLLPLFVIKSVPTISVVKLQNSHLFLIFYAVNAYTTTTTTTNTTTTTTTIFSINFHEVLLCK